MRALFESLEGRNLFSMTSVDDLLPDDDHALAFAIASPAAVTTELIRIVGTWKGSLTVNGVHTEPATLTVTKQKASGKYFATLTTSQDQSIKVAVTGKVKANRKINITVDGTHSGGSIDGTGSGKIKKSGNKIVITMDWTQGGQSFPGSLTLKRS